MKHFLKHPFGLLRSLAPLGPLALFLCLALSAQAQNTVIISSANGHPQDEVTLNVSLSNTDAAVAFQAEIPLGNQLTYVASSVALNPDRVTDHQVTAAVVNGNLRIYVYSLSLTPFVGNEGTLLSFALKLKNEPGDYPLVISNAVLSSSSGSSLPISPINPTSPTNALVTILSPKLSITTPSLNYGHVPIRSEYTQTAQVSNVGNEPLTITGINFSDAVFSCPSFAVTTLQPGTTKSFTFKFAPVIKGAVNATATIASNSIAGNGIVNVVADPFAVNEIHVGNVMGYCDSIVALPISMNNMEDIIGFQIEANLSDALEFVDFMLSDRKSDHVGTGVVSGTNLRLMAYSPSGSAFTGEDGLLGTVYFRLHGLYGNYYLNPTKAVLADANGEDVLSAKYQGYVTIRSPRITGNSTLSFGSTPVTETVTKEYVVSNNGNAQMRIDQVVFDQEGFDIAESFPITVNQYASTTLHVSYSREQKGDFNALMKIYSNDPQNGLKNVALSGNRYEPNTIGLEADPFALDDGEVLVTLSLDNYSDIVAMQLEFGYPYQNFSVEAADFQLTDRSAGHLMYAIPVNDSTFRVIVLSMQNTPVEGHEGVMLNVTLHPIGLPADQDYTVGVSNIVLSGVEGLNLFTGTEVATMFQLAVTQGITLQSGWNWYSGYIAYAPDALDVLENSISNAGALSIIKSQSGFVGNESGVWYGSLDDLDNAQMYMIQVDQSISIAMTGWLAKPSLYPITLNQGWTWIGYPSAGTMPLSEALSSLDPTEGDVIKGQASFATYSSAMGWVGTLDDFMPGSGYIYLNNGVGDMTLVYPASSRGVADESGETCYWTHDIHRFRDNMTLMLTLDDEDFQLGDGSHEVGAFVDGECRGSARMQHLESLALNVAFLTVNGSDGETVIFKVYDVERNEVHEGVAREQLVFGADDVYGSLRQPWVLHFGDTGAAPEVTMSASLEVLPNPVNCGETLHLVIPDYVGRLHVELYNLLGMCVGTMDTRNGWIHLDQTLSSGTYLLKARTTSGNGYYGKLIIK